MSREILIKINYVFLSFLLSGALLIIINYENPERLIQGEWEEKHWSLEKDNAGLELANDNYLQLNLRREILRNIENLHLGTWKFQQDGSLTSEGDHSDKMEWLIKGRGHILELRRDGKQVESFQIQQISDERMVLHLNFDLQVKGVIEIVLEKVNQKGSYAKKV